MFVYLVLYLFFMESSRHKHKCTSQHLMYVHMARLLGGAGDMSDGNVSSLVPVGDLKI